MRRPVASASAAAAATRRAGEQRGVPPPSSEPSSGEGAEGEDAAGERAGDERGARGERRPAPAGRRPSVATIENPHGDHDPVSPATSARDDEQRPQHGTFVSKYMTQKTRRPL